MENWCHNSAWAETKTARMDEQLVLKTSRYCAIFKSSFVLRVNEKGPRMGDERSRMDEQLVLKTARYCVIFKSGSMRKDQGSRIKD